MGCFVLNERQEVLMVQEGSGPLKGKGTLLTACSRMHIRLERGYGFHPVS